MTMVRPPPGVSSGTRVPPITLMSPRATASPRPSPSPCGASPTRWKAAKMRSLSASATPGPRSMTRSCTVSPMRPAVTRTSASPLCLRAFSTTLASTRSSRPRSARTRGRSGSRSTSTRCGADVVRTRRDDGIEQVDRVVVGPHGPGLEPGEVEQVADEGVEAVGALLDRLEQLGLVLGRQLEAGLTQGGHAGLDAGERGAQVVRDGREQGRAGGVVAGQPGGLAGGPDELLASVQDRGVGGVGVDDALVLGGDGRPVEQQVHAVVDRDVERPRRVSAGTVLPRQERVGRGDDRRRPVLVATRRARRTRIPRSSRAPVEQRRQGAGLGQQVAAHRREGRRLALGRDRLLGASGGDVDDRRDRHGDEHEDGERQRRSVRR